MKLGLFSPRGGAFTGTTVSLFADRNVTFEVVDDPAGRDGSLSRTFLQQPRDERPAAAPGSAAVDRLPLAVLRTQQNPSWLRGRLVRHPLAISHDDRIVARISPGWVEVRQETSLQVRHGSVSSLTVRVPVSQPDLWQVQGKETIRQEPLAAEAGDGDARRYRLSFAPPIVEGSSLVFRFRVPMNPALSTASEVKSTIPWVLLEEGSTGLTTVELSMAREIRSTVEDPAWAELGMERPGPHGSEAPRQYRLVKPGMEKGGFPFSARLAEQVSLPPLVCAPSPAANRPRSRERVENQGLVLDRVSSFPPGVQSAGGSAVDSLADRRTGRGPAREQPGRRRLPAEHPRPNRSPSRYWSRSSTRFPRIARDRPGSRPELNEGAVVLQTLWEVQIPWSQALVGVPEGWADENEWYWDLYVWKRRPWRSFSRLVAWVAGATPAVIQPGRGARRGARRLARIPVRPGRAAGLLAALGGLPRLAGRDLLGQRAPAGLLPHVLQGPLPGALGGGRRGRD